MSEGNGKAGLSYVLKDMSDAQKGMERAQDRLAKCTLPDFKACPAGGEEFHAAMAGMSHAQNDGILALLQWQTVQVKREMERAQGLRHDRREDDHDEPQPEIKTKWVTARGVAAMLPATILGVLIIIVILVEVLHK
jgi:hypothetical protein